MLFAYARHYKATTILEMQIVWRQNILLIFRTEKEAMWIKKKETDQRIMLKKEVPFPPNSMLAKIRISTLHLNLLSVK